MAWTEEAKKTAEYYIEGSDWFYNGWFYGWFGNPTSSFIEEIKKTTLWTEEER